MFRYDLEAIVFRHIQDPNHRLVNRVANSAVILGGFACWQIDAGEWHFNSSFCGYKSCGPDAEHIRQGQKSSREGEGAPPIGPIFVYLEQTLAGGSRGRS